MAKRFVLTSSARLEKVYFETVADAEAFLASRKISQENICLADKIKDEVILVRNYY